MTKTLCALWDLTGEPLANQASKWNSFFDPIGLILHGDFENFGYWCTPKNTATFASTGGDGVHYGLIDLGDGYVDASPVVMTVPMCDTPNVIVGSTLLEFLALGCRQGYFSLEQLIYQREMQLALLDSGCFDDEANEHELSLIESINDRFGLQPWKHHESRLRTLHEAYHVHLNVAPEAD